jgi:hypothetical protein
VVSWVFDALHTTDSKTRAAVVDAALNIFIVDDQTDPAVLSSILDNFDAMVVERQNGNRDDFLETPIASLITALESCSDRMAPHAARIFQLSFELASSSDAEENLYLRYYIMDGCAK